MKKYFEGFFYSLPIQLVFLHFRRYQILLLFWFILFATISGHFLKAFGADSLMLAPEYLGNVSAISIAFVGFTIGSYIMSWNITTFILHTKRIRFLATTAQPFLKYCINNSVIPVVFLCCYCWFAVQYQLHEEFASTGQILLLTAGFLGGFLLSLIIAFGYFFGTDKNIYRKMATDITTANEKYERASRIIKKPVLEKPEMRVDWFFSATFGFRKPRNVKHYSQEFLSSIFKRHHIAAIQAVFLALVMLIVLGFFGENKYFQIPAAASITLFFTILIAVAGSLSLFLGNWSVPVVLLIYFGVNWLYQQHIIDPRNKAYGLNYNNYRQQPNYTKDTLFQLANASAVQRDSLNFVSILNSWKAKQAEEKPVMFIVDVSGGGNRSADFVMNVLMRLDTVTGGDFFKHTFLINGSSGGMMGAAYFRELYLQKLNGKLPTLQQKKFLDNISTDLLNPVFSSLVTRDMIGPLRNFNLNNNSYILDRGYSFEQKLNVNTNKVFNKNLGDYNLPEKKALIPYMIFSSTITRDGRKLLISTQPTSFLMKAHAKQNHLSDYDIDAVDFQSFFKNEDPGKLRFLSVLRMNATFPFVLPNVELPSKPRIDVMDGGLRDNFGHECTLRFLDVFKDWLQQNTSAVVIVEIRDRPRDSWQTPFEIKSLSGLITKPILLLQSDWFNLQDFYEKDQINYILACNKNIYFTSFAYEAAQNAPAASLSFHLTSSEKKGIAQTLADSTNLRSFAHIQNFLIGSR